MTRFLLAVAALLALSATAAAEYDPDKPPCPPDMMCTTSGPDEPVSDGAGTCMDGEDDGEACRDDVQYLDGEEPAPAGDPETGPAAENLRESPLPALAGAAALGAALLVGRR